MDLLSRWHSRLDSLRRVAFDSNAFIYFLETRQPYAPYIAAAINRLQAGSLTGIVSVVVEMEVFVKPLREGNLGVQYDAELFLRNCPNLAIRVVDRIVARRAADVRARTRFAPLDSIIVATALEERCDAIIGNDSRIASRQTGLPYLYLDDYL